MFNSRVENYHEVVSCSMKSINGSGEKVPKIAYYPETLLVQVLPKSRIASSRCAKR